MDSGLARSARPGMTARKLFRSIVGLAPSRSSSEHQSPKRKPVMSKIVPCLWFNGNAEEAVNFYVSLLPDSRIETVQRNVVDGPSGSTGSVLVMEFSMAGQKFMALNGGMKVEYTHAVSFKIDCADQAEVDRLWDALCADGG